MTFVLTVRSSHAAPRLLPAVVPTAPPRVCNRCKQPTPKNGPCRCRPAFEGSSHPGNSDLKWRRLSTAYRKRHPHCEVPGCTSPTVNVDHIQTWAEAPHLRYEWRNLQALCKPHHDMKTQADALRGKTRAR